MNSPKKLRALFWTAAMVLLPAGGLLGQFTYVESFTSTTAEGWVFGSESGGFTPILTANSIDSDGDGWLRLSTASGNQSNYAYLDSPIKTVGNEVSITFDYTVHSGNGADGITFFMFDASETFDAGAFGGSLGYANHDNGPGDVVDGMAGGYFGLGLDTYGNYSNPTEGRNGGEGFLADEIVLRGPGSGQTGYEYIAGTGGINTTDGDAPIDSLDVDLQFSQRPVTGQWWNEDNYYTVNIYIDPDQLLTVSIDDDLDGNFTALFTADLSGFDVPEELKLGYAASTGGLNNIHEIRNLEVTTTSQPVGAEFWDNDLGNDNWDDTTGGGSISNWVSDGLPVNWADIFFGDDYNNGSPNAAEDVDIEQDRNVRSINFDNAYDYTIDGGNGDNFVIGAPNGGYATINVSEANYTSAGDNTVTHTIEVPITLDDDLTITNVSDSADLILDGNFTTNNNDITVNTTGAGLVTLDSDISGSTEITKTGSGTLVFSDNDIDFSGGLNIDEGTVLVREDSSKLIMGTDSNNANYLGTGDINIADDGALVLDNDFGGSGNDIEFYGDVNTSGTVTLETEDQILIDSDATWNQTGGTTTVSGDDMLLEGVLTVDGNGTVFNVNTTDGLLVNDAGPTPVINITDGGVLDVSGDVDLDEGTLNGGGTNAGTLKVGGDLSVDVNGFGATITGSPNITMDGTGTQSVEAYDDDGALTGIGTFTQEGTSTTTIDSSITSFGANEIVIEAGTLMLGRNNQITNGTDMTLAGGTFATGGYDDTLDTLTLTADSTIDLSGGDSILNFDDSSGNSWTGGEELFITNWGGTPETGGGSDQLYFGSNSSGLTSGQVGQIIFVNPNGLSPGLYYAQILGDGEIVPGLPVVPEPSTYLGGGLLIGLAGLHFWRRRRAGRDEEDRG